MERKSRKIWVRFFTLLCLLTLSVSCSSSEDGEESTDNAGADTSAPTVTDVSPKDGAAGVSVSSKISVTFNKSILHFVCEGINSRNFFRINISK